MDDQDRVGHGMSGNRVSRRTALGFMLSATGATLLAACGPAVSTPAAPTAPPPPPTTSAAKPGTPAADAGAPTQAAKPAAQQIKRGGTLRWGQVGDLVTIDGIFWSPVTNNTIG